VRHRLLLGIKLLNTLLKQGVLTRGAYRYPFDHQSPAMLGPDSSWMGDEMTSSLGAVVRCTHILWPGMTLKKTQMSNSAGSLNIA
jgi:hypothetical protein